MVFRTQKWPFFLIKTPQLILTLPRSDSHGTSSYNVHTLSSKQEMRILKSGSCYLDLRPNSCNYLTRKCVETRGENEQSFLGSERVLIVILRWY